MKKTNCIIMGAAGRDFHDFLTFFAVHPELRVCCFTAEQIPFIADRVFPAALAGPAYDQDIPIVGEDQLEAMIAAHEAELVFLSFSDLAHEDVMHRACRVQAAGASFVLLGPKQTQLVAEIPVVAVTASRTGAGKSPISQTIARHLRASCAVAVMRHPMPYGQLLAQRVQRFASRADLDAGECTIEEREEYTPYVDAGMAIYAGIDYRTILEKAQGEADVLVWDGGNNDTPFVRPDLGIVVVDALRPGHEARYYPGETNVRMADVVVVNKVSDADADAIAQIERNVAALNPRAVLVHGDLVVSVADGDADKVRGKRVLVIEDGPTVTHGGMSYGAGTVAARLYGAGALIDPRPHAIGSVAHAYASYPHLAEVLPALGYSEAQRRELAATVAAARPDVVLDASPARLGSMLAIEQEVVEVSYRFEQRQGPDLLALVDAAVAKSSK